MQDGSDSLAEAAGQWLRDHPEDAVTIELARAEPSPAAYREIQEILFGPEEIDQAT